MDVGGSRQLYSRPMPEIVILTWNICGDGDTRVDDGKELLQRYKPHVAVFQEGRKTKPTSSKLYKMLTGEGYAVETHDEFGAFLKFNGQNYYPDVKIKTYYCCFNKQKFAARKFVDHGLADYLPHIDQTNAQLLTTRKPWHFELKLKGDIRPIHFFTWHAPLAPVGGRVFNYAAHYFFVNFILARFKINDIVIIAGDMNATQVQVNKIYPDDYESVGHGLDHILFKGGDVKDAWWAADKKSDVHFALGAKLTWKLG